MATETEPIPNLIMGNSEWAVSKSKKWDGFLKPKSEPVPNGNSETAICGSAMSRVSRISCQQRNCGSSSCGYGRPSRPSSDRYRRRVWWGGSRRECGMPAPGKSWSVTLRAGEVAFHPGRTVTGAGERGRFRTAASGLSCRSADALVIHITKQCSTEYGQNKAFSSIKNSDRRSSSTC